MHSKNVKIMIDYVSVRMYIRTVSAEQMAGESLYLMAKRGFQGGVNRRNVQMHNLLCGQEVSMWKKQ